MRVLEGAWEELVQLHPELTGHQVRIIVLDTESAEARVNLNTRNVNTAMLAAMQEVDDIQRDMLLTSGGDSQTYLRDARAGAMYGYDADE